MSYRMTTPLLTYADSYSGSIRFAAPLDNAITYSTSRDGSESHTSLAGNEDGWLVARDQWLEGDARWIPTSGSTTVTGWDDGWKGMLAWGRQKNVLHWYPDATSTGSFVAVYLHEPMTGAPSVEIDGTKRVHLKLRATGSAAITGY